MTSKFFVLCSVNPPPKDGEWDDMCEFVTGDKEDMRREFDKNVMDGEYPLIFFGEIHAYAEGT